MIYENIAKEIKARVKIGDALFMYGFSASPNSKKRIPCPLHNGNDNNFSFTDKIYHCWVCGEPAKDGYKVCERHYKVCIENQKKAKEAVRKMLDKWE